MSTDVIAAKSELFDLECECVTSYVTHTVTLFYIDISPQVHSV